MNTLGLQPPTCVNNVGTLCRTVFDMTGNVWLSGAVDWLAKAPLRILIILVVAFVIRFVARRTIDRLARGAGNGKTPRLLKPLKERAPQAVGALVSERRQQRAQTIGSVMKSLVSFLVYGLAFILILGEIGINLGPIIASAGIVGVAIGFGAQNLVKDFLSGVFMMLEDQYGVGDIVDVGPATGTIESVGLRVTTLRDVNGTVWYVRNGEILRVGNSSQGFAVAVVDIPLAYSTDIEAATDVIKRIVDDEVAGEPVSDDVLEPPELLGVDKVTPESITVRLTVKVRAGRQWAVQRALRARIIPALEEAGIEPPLGRLYPQK
ncbi:mechanosensitive ion channel family protein [Kibdelosporangium philippinense]|uniref:Mechanosensitive ion channel family protein n=1 Tax=Kibdelosporangium philippinense TaxID=211113 RepID=A0ABS8ZNY4_9PSEU|nr:mechanosensitive ion channel family protein [Kibdelosporangium philippinense]MCE7007512.1 mechanosensitive ion channel family protein [Kibdelosporangium philippinense]